MSGLPRARVQLDASCAPPCMWLSIIMLTVSMLLQTADNSAEASGGAKRGRGGAKKLKPYTPAKMVGLVINPVWPSSLMPCLLCDA